MLVSSINILQVLSCGSKTNKRVLIYLTSGNNHLITKTVGPTVPICIVPSIVPSIVIKNWINTIYHLHIIY